MATKTVLAGNEVDRSISVLQGALERLESAEGELMLDLSAVHRMDAAEVRMMEALASRAEEKNVRIVLRGVTVDIYKVLKLVKVADRFAFLP